MHERTGKSEIAENRPRLATERDISIELAPEQVPRFNPAPEAFPRGSRVFLTHLEGKPLELQVDAARCLKAAGFIPVPHIGAKHFASARQYSDLLRAHSENGVHEALIIGGNPLTPAGPFADAAALLDHPALADSAIQTVFLGGYPEGHPAISAEKMNAALGSKLVLCRDHNLEARLVSQFAFDGKAIATWAAGIQRAHPGLPVHVGLAGVTSIPKLIKFAMLCGVGPSLAMLRRSATGLFNILADKDPGEILDAVEQGYPADLPPLGLHFYPFGGWEKTLAWVERRRQNRIA